MAQLLFNERVVASKKHELHIRIHTKAVAIFSLQKLDGDEQNPERNIVSLRLGCEGNTVMSNKHLNFHPTSKVIWQFL